MSESEPANTGRTRDGKGRWLKGAPSPNPHGRRATPQEVRDLWDEHTVTAQQVVLDTMLKAEDPELRFRAAVHWLDRGLGKPAQSLDVTARAADPAAVAGQPDAARARLEALIAEAAGTDMQTVAPDGNAQAAQAFPAVEGDAVASGLPGGTEGGAQ